MVNLPLPMFHSALSSQQSQSLDDTGLAQEGANHGRGDIRSLFKKC
jgi:hypothetical protein